MAFFTFVLQLCFNTHVKKAILIQRTNGKHTFQDHPEFHNELVCGKEGTEPTQMSHSRICPMHCTTKLSQHFNQNNVNITADGKFRIINPSPALKVSVLSIHKTRKSRI